MYFNTQLNNKDVNRHTTGCDSVKFVEFQLIKNIHDNKKDMPYLL